VGEEMTVAAFAAGYILGGITALVAFALLVRSE
jgi:hypothetical protein